MRSFGFPFILSLPFLAAILTGCQDRGLGLVALDLEITVLSEDEKPVEGAVVWLEDRGPSSSAPVGRRFEICTTAADGKCAGALEYTYDVRRWRWQAAGGGRRSEDRFEVSVERGAEAESLGFLPPLTAGQFHGAEVALFTGRVSGRPRPRR